MKYLRPVGFAVIYASLVLTAFAQVSQFKDVPGRKDVMIAYNRFKDETTVLTKRHVVGARVGRVDQVIELSAGYVFSGQTIHQPVTEIALAIMPDAQTLLGDFTQRLRSNNRYIKAKLNIPLDSEVIFIVDGVRMRLGKVSKPFSQNATGDFDDNAYLIMPVADFRRIASAQRVEVAVGNIELYLADKHIKRWSELLVDLEQRQGSLASQASVTRTTSETRPAPSAPAPAPTPKRICAENGHRIPCPEDKAAIK